MKPKKISVGELDNLPFGSVIRKKNNLYFKNRGIDGPIFTDADGIWFFVTDLETKWEKTKDTIELIFCPYLA